MNQTTGKVSVDDFANSIKAQYPQYAKIDNATLAQKMVTKYPVYAQHVDIPQPAQQKPDLLDTATNAVESVLPGKQIGESLVKAGTNVANLVTGGLPKYKANLADNTVDVPKLIGDYGAAGLTAVAPAVGGSGGVVAKVGANAALGAGLGASNSLSQGGNAGDIAAGAGEGAALGGALSGAAEGINGLVNKLPSWLVKSALPKLKDGTVDYALENTKLGSTKQMLGKSVNAVNSYGSQIKNVLSHPQYAEETGAVKNILPAVQSKFENAGLQDSKLLSIVKRVAPNNATLVDKIQNGTATLKEQNSLRQELDHAVYPKFTDTPSLTFNKQVGKAFADELRANVQGTAKETQPIFKEYAKELDLHKSLTALNKKNNLRPTFKDLASGYAGYEAGGLKGAALGIAAERLGGSAGGRIAAAKGIQAVGKTAPAANALLQGAKAPIIRAATGQNKKGQ